MPHLSWLQRIVDELAEVGTREVRLTGGEPVLHPAFFEVLACIEGHGMGISVITNGTLFAPHFHARALKSGIGRVLLSLDTPVAEKHNRIRAIKGLFELGTRGVREWLDQSPGGAVEVNMVITRETVEDIEQAIDYCAGLRAEVLNLLPVKDWPELYVTEEQMRRHNDRAEGLIRLARERGLRVTPPDFDLFGFTAEALTRSGRGVYPTRHGCYVPFLEAFVDSITGLVWPCNSTPYEQRNCHTCGDLNEARFADIWFGERFNRLRQAYRNARPVPCSNKCDAANAHHSLLYRRAIEGAELPASVAPCPGR
jgi:MoaA/NifB/PqqE/SkfB family radical SAM enzyme